MWHVACGSGVWRVACSVKCVMCGGMWSVACGVEGVWCMWYSMYGQVGVKENKWSQDSYLSHNYILSSVRI
jgi:hypothetical protein